MSKTSETLQIDGMSCQHCVRAVRDALEETEGVDVRDVQIGSAHVDYDPDETDRRRILEAVEDAGFSVRE